MATDLSRKMITEWGMSDKMGPVAYSSGDSNPFLGRDYAKPSAIAEQTAMEIDKEVRRIISEQYKLASTLLYENLDMLKSLAEALLEYEVLGSDEIEAIVKGEDIRALKDLKEAKKSERSRTPKTGYTSKLRDELRGGDDALSDSDANTDADDQTEIPDTPTALEGES
jgi:cell division protease FtsH